MIKSRFLWYRWTSEARIQKNTFCLSLKQIATLNMFIEVTEDVTGQLTGTVNFWV